MIEILPDDAMARGRKLLNHIRGLDSGSSDADTIEALICLANRADLANRDAQMLAEALRLMVSVFFYDNENMPALKQAREALSQYEANKEKNND